MTIAFGMHVLAGAALFWSSIPAVLIWAMLAIIGANYWLVVFRVRYFRSMSWRADGSWQLCARNGHRVSAKLDCRSVALSYLTLLNFVSVAQRKRFSIVVFTTTDNADAIRHLRVRLRLDGVNPE